MERSRIESKVSEQCPQVRQETRERRRPPKIAWTQDVSARDGGILEGLVCVGEVELKMARVER